MKIDTVIMLNNKFLLGALYYTVTTRNGGSYAPLAYEFRPYLYAYIE